MTFMMGTVQHPNTELSTVLPIRFFYISTCEHRIGDFLVGLMAKSEQPDCRLTLGNGMSTVNGHLRISAQGLLIFFDGEQQEPSEAIS